ncbi:hypothetical protein F4804DRAFT_334129 [Jackrogersella minutella]|nr:hypothetical protein F4804DRAFT_334129 [Jackrogersella minutella]
MSSSDLTGSSVLLGPLTTTWTPPPACMTVEAGCSNCNYGWLAQSCSGDAVRDASTCWPPRTSNAPTPTQPFGAFGVYSPGTVCPYGYSTACSYNGAMATHGFDFFFQPEVSETAIGCCPTGYACIKNNFGQTCITVMTSTIVPTATCESWTSAQFQDLAIPYTIIGDDGLETISDFTAYAPLFQLNHQVSDLLTTTETTVTSSDDNVRTSPVSISSTSALQTSPTEPPREQGLSTGARVGIGCGVPLGIIILGAIAFCLFRSQRRRTVAFTPVGQLTEKEAEPAAELEAPRDVAELETISPRYI